MKNTLRSLLISFAIASILAACTSVETRTTASSLSTAGPPERVIVTGSAAPTEAYVHSWTAFSKQGGELPGAGMCTYVLFGKQIDKSSGSGTFKLYERLLDELTVTTSKFSPSEAEDLSHHNVFHVPVTGEPDANRPLIDSYNYALAKRYLDKFARAINSRQAAVKLQANAGPFLITTMKPLPATSGDIYALYADLSDLHPTAISELLRAYKARVTTRRVTETEAFGPLSVRVLSGILKAQDDLEIAKVSVLAWMKFGGDKK
jgi:hypothetical protein